MPRHDVRVSTLYDGGGAGNALQTLATGATIVAGGEAVIPIAEGAIALDIWLMNSTVSSTCRLQVSEFSAATPTVATMIRKCEYAIGATDETGTADRAAWGLATGVEYAPKAPMRVKVSPGSYVMLSVASSSGGTWYCRYQLRFEVDIDAEIEADLAATETALAAIQAVLDDMDAEIVAASGIELLCVAASTSYNTGAVLTAGVTYEITAENGTIYLGVADTTNDANKEMTVPAGATRRFTMPATKTTLYYSTEDGAGIVGRISRVA